MTATSLPKPLGFPSCPRCPLRFNGTARICADCAARSFQPVSESHCAVCSQALALGVECSNVICRWPLERRAFTRVDAVAMYSEHLKRTIKTFKYTGIKGWAVIFGRIVVGWLDMHADELADIDLIVGNPSYSGRSPFQHIEAILEAARIEDISGRWHIPADPILVKCSDTRTSANSSWRSKLEAAKEHVAALELRGSVEGKRILLFDDIFTTGAQIHTVAKLLNEAEASSVRGLVLARVPWGNS